MKQPRRSWKPVVEIDAEMIQEARVRAGLTVRELCSATDVSPETFYRILRGKGGPGSTKAICDFLQVRMSDVAKVTVPNHD